MKGAQLTVQMDLTCKIIQNRYHVEEKLGEGLDSVVYRVTDVRYGRKLALKFFRRSDSDGESLSAEFRKLSALRHPNVVEIMNFGQYDGKPFFTMELVDGAEYGSGVEPGHPDREFLFQSFHLLQGLRFIHRNGYRHGDIKPSNIRLSGTGRIKLLDFGLAEPLEAAESEGKVSGTVGYMAPEVIRGHKTGAAADIYALGVIWHEIFTGSPPYSGDTRAELLEAHLKKPVPRIESSLRVDFPEKLSRLVYSMLARRPAYRPSPGQCAEVIRALAEEDGHNVDDFIPEPAIQFFSCRQQLLEGMISRINERKGDRAFFITGGPSCGKTRMLDELRNRFEVMNIPALMVGAKDRTDVTADMISFAENIAGASEEEHLENEADYSNSTERQIRGRLPEEFRRALTRLEITSKRKPAAVIFDDAHLLKGLDRQAMNYYLHRVMTCVNDKPLFAVMSASENSLEKFPFVDPKKWTKLQFFSKDEITRYCLDFLYVLESEIPPDAVNALYRRTRGNLLYLKILLQTMISEKQLDFSKGRRLFKNISPEYIEQIPIDDAKSYCVYNLKKFTHNSIEKIKMLALFETGFTQKMVSALLETTDATASSMIDSLVEQGMLVRKTAPGEPWYSFSHAMLRDCLRERVSSGEYVRMHRKIGDYLIHRFSESDEDMTIKRMKAYHFIEAGDAERGLRFGFELGYENRKRYNLEDAYGVFSSIMKFIPLENESGRLVFHSNRKRELKELEIRVIRSAARSLYEMGKWRTALDYYRFLAEYFTERGLPLEASIGLQMKANCLQRIGGMDEAKSLLDQASNALDAAVQNDETAAQKLRIKFSYGEWNTQSGFFEKAGELYREIIEQNRRDDLLETSEKARLENNLASLLYRQGKFGEAGERFRMALGHFRQTEDQSGQMSCFHNLGTISYSEGDYEKAREYFTEALKICGVIGDHNSWIIINNNLGLTYSAQWRWREAEQYYRRSLSAAEHFGKTNSMPLSLINLGNLNVTKGALNSAEKCFTRVIDMAELPETNSWKIQAIVNLGYLEILRKRYDVSGKLFQKAVQSAKRNGLTNLMINGELGLCEAMIGRGNAEKAMILCRSIAEKEETQRTTIGKRLRIEAMVQSMRGNAIEAEERFKKSLEIFKKENRKRELGVTLLEYGRFCASAGRSSEALKHLTDAKEIFKNMDYRPMLFKAYVELKKLSQ